MDGWQQKHVLASAHVLAHMLIFACPCAHVHTTRRHAHAHVHVHTCTAYIYIRGEFWHEYHRVQAAVEQAYAKVRGGCTLVMCV